jgi:hypothetical protein
MITAERVSIALRAVAAALTLTLLGVALAYADELGFMGEAIFNRIDANHDGVISADEGKAARERMFDKIDADHDGVVTAAAAMLAEFADFERTLADAVRPAPFGAGEIGAVLRALDAREEACSPTPRFWIASAGLSVLSFAAGFIAMAIAASQDISPSLIDFASGQANLGGLL